MIYRKYLEMEIFKLFLLVSVKERVLERGFFTSFTSYPSWRKRQNNLILMGAETGKRVFTSWYRTAPQNQLLFIFALFPYTWVTPHLGLIRLYCLEERKTIEFYKYTAVFSTTHPWGGSADVSTISFHNLPVYFCMFIQNGNLLFLTNFSVLFCQILAMISAKAQHLWVIIYMITCIEFCYKSNMKSKSQERC